MGQGLFGGLSLKMNHFQQNSWNPDLGEKKSSILLLQWQKFLVKPQQPLRLKFLLQS